MGPNWIKMNCWVTTKVITNSKVHLKSKIKNPKSKYHYSNEVTTKQTNVPTLLYRQPVNWKSGQTQNLSPSIAVNSIFILKYGSHHSDVRSKRNCNGTHQPHSSHGLVVCSLVFHTSKSNNLILKRINNKKKKKIKPGPNLY